MKFDVVVGNPPFQSNKEKSAVSSRLWDKFVYKALAVCKEDGYISLIHPSPWRKPNNVLYTEFAKRKLKYLEIHNLKDGLKTFSCSTRYDWYILQNSKNDGGKSIVKDENGKVKKIDMSEWDFLPNCDYDLFESLLAKKDEKKCEILFSYSGYETRKPWMSKTKTKGSEVIYSRSAYGYDKKWVAKTETKEYKYPCVYMMTKKNPLILSWSNTNQKGHFGVPKVIINLMGATLCCLVDYAGEYGMTQWAFGIEIESKEEGEKIKKAVMSEEFKKIWKATQWLSMTREWRIFNSFRADFWKEFI